MIEITVVRGDGSVMARESRENEALMCAEGAYYEGDSICISTDEGKHLTIQVDAAVLPAQVYLPVGSMTYKIPFGEALRAYSPAAFTGERHIITAKAMTQSDITARRNIALNPADLRGDTDFFPHAAANVETRGESVFAARNVIDGMRHNHSHGDWPFQSWGIGAREDAWLKIDFGREVQIYGMALTLRADFPHDAYWTRGHAVMSDGSDIEFELKQTDEAQHITTGEHKVRWLRLERLQKSDDPSAFPALSECEVYGRDI